MTLRVKHNLEKNNLHLGDIFIPPSQQGKGTGTRAVKGLTKYADIINATTSLRQSATPGKEKALKKFYSKFGFKKKRGTKNTYIRKPVSR